MSGSIVQSSVVVVILAVTQIRVQILPELGGTLVNLHGGKLIAVLQVLLEFRRGAAHRTLAT